MDELDKFFTKTPEVVKKPKKKEKSFRIENGRYRD